MALLFSECGLGYRPNFIGPVPGDHHILDAAVAEQGHALVQHRAG